MGKDMPRTVTVSDEEILSQFKNSPGPVDTAPDLAERLPIQSDAVRLRLNELEAKGKVKSRMVGSRAVVWWIPRD
ncbi:hypothetical protein DP108_06315 [Halosegnis rubeus]|uniref:Uncharacterized protein n=1 Tax=Halosegnis rubeus TaxID=2212850 RepID=A0A5N5UJ85_9EURY|nr:hypothetical protein DP108_06315 [Halosegnis rubeus]